MQRSRPPSLATATILTFALLVSSCAGRARIQPQFPNAADVEAGQEAKPEPPITIVTDPQARADYRAEVENWGDRVHDAWVRACRAMNDMGGKFTCGETSTERALRLMPR